MAQEKITAKVLERWLEEGRVTCSVEQAGQADHMGKTASHQAAGNGSMPFVVINGRKRVPIALWLRKLRGDVAAMLLTISVTMISWWM